MAGKSVALDTNIIVAHFRTAGKHDGALHSHRLYLPHVVVAELYAGAFKSARPDHHLGIIDTFLTTVTPLAANLDTAKIYGRVWADLAKHGQMIPQNDIWIAALCMQYEMPLVTEDAHFDAVSGLNVERW